MIKVRNKTDDLVALRNMPPNTCLPSYKSSEIGAKYGNGMFTLEVFLFY